MLLHSHFSQRIGLLCGLIAVTGLCQTTAAQPAQRTLFCANNVSGNVSVYTVNSDGTLSEIAGSPFAAGNNPQALALTEDGSVLAVVNATIAVFEQLKIFSVGPTGALTEAVGSPEIVGDGPLGLAIGRGSTGDEFCFVPSASNDEIHVFSITGTTFNEVAGSPFATANFPNEVAVTPDGGFLYVSHLFGQVSGYSIGAGGALTAVTGSPYTINGDGFELITVEDNLYIGTGLDNVIDSYQVQVDGSLSLLAGAPYATGGNSAVNLAATPSGDFVFVVHVVSDSVISMARAANGSLSVVPGSSQVIGNDARKAVADDDYLFVTDESTLDPGVGVMSYAIAGDGTLSLVAGSPFAAGTRPQDLVLFSPPPSCPCNYDFDFDGDVDLGDFSVFTLCFGGANVPPAPSCPTGIDADCDGDGDVDLGDFAQFSLCFTGPI